MDGIHITFAEDDRTLNFTLSEILEESGYSVHSFYCGSAAIAAIDGREYLAALLTDIDLGPGPDGFNVARHARGFFPHLPVLFISGTMAAHHAFHGVRGSVLISKPFHPHQIVAALDRMIRLETA